MIRPYGANMFNIKEIKDKAKIVKADIRDRRAVKKCIAKKDYVFHLAGQVSRLISMENPVLDNQGCLVILCVKNYLLKFWRVKHRILLGISIHPHLWI